MNSAYVVHGIIQTKKIGLVQTGLWLPCTHVQHVSNKKKIKGTTGPLKGKECDSRAA